MEPFCSNSGPVVVVDVLLVNLGSNLGRCPAAAAAVLSCVMSNIQSVGVAWDGDSVSYVCCCCCVCLASVHPAPISTDDFPLAQAGDTAAAAGDV